MSLHRSGRPYLSRPLRFRNGRDHFRGAIDLQLVARGLLSGTATDSLGTIIGSVTAIPITLPVATINGTCEILHLELGPLDLDLLGLVIHLEQVVLDITAEQGPGNLLGNLLCAIAGLLDGGAPLNSIVRILNRIIGILG
jgi:hypothetical protein